MKPLLLVAAAAAALLLAACGEHSQAEPARLKSADAKAFTGTPGESKVFSSSGWTPGNETSWQTQIRDRTQGQNEYVRIASTQGSATAGSLEGAGAPAMAASEPAAK